MALDITLIVVSSIFALLIIVAALYFLIYFQHPDDKWRAWFPKFVVVAGLSLSAYNIFLLPLDVANQRGSVTGGIPLGTMTMLTIVFYITTTIMVLVVVPFTVFWYEGLDNDDDVESSSLGKQILYAVKWVIPLDLLMFGGIIALYWFFGSASIKVVNLTGNLQPRGDFINFDYCAQPFTCIKTNTIVNVAVSPFVYVIACVSFLGSVIMSIFGGLGFIALPIDLIEGFIHRTKPISTALYEERKAIIGQKATILHEAGEAIMAEIKGQKQGGIGLNRRQRNLKRKENDFRRDVMIIEIHYQRLEDSYKHAGGDFLLQIGKLVAGIIG
ncbi:hypothetical protein HK099_006329 [Clydaea vesicula]|uniref:LMBR1-like membrane protein n=1 Tax=Clydaea vesicula TaxID=447962 RepID=A0AAD5XYG0_9FUNG|nr:hypothetical protein HK099_006329 [Clydaea vesicula]KAJ3389957.1 hypothetical protein HDU92_000767 [Lobulomyces angularis]